MFLDLAVGVMTVKEPPKDRAKILELIEKRVKPFVAEEDFKIFVDDKEDHCHVAQGTNAMRTWEWAASRGKKWVLVLQDDAVPCKDVEYGIGRLMAVAPDRFICLLDLTSNSYFAVNEKKHWVRSRANVYGVANMVPTYMALDMLRWLKENHNSGICECDDCWIAAWMIRNNIYCWHFVPCLFQHGSPSSSLVGHNNKNRICKHCVAPDGSAYDIFDYKAGIESPVRTNNQRVENAYVTKNFRSSMK